MVNHWYFGLLILQKFNQENIYVSSDDQDILNISKNEINFIKRPKKYSLSSSKSIDVVRHFLDKLKIK